MEEIVQLTQSLIRFRSTGSRPEEIHRCMDFIEDYLSENDIRYSPFVHNGVRSLFVLPEHRSVRVLLMSHIDVVDGPDTLFEPQIRDGLLHGRGSIDDKYAAALSLVLVKTHLAGLRKEGKGQNDLPFGILITSDEETGGPNGAKKALEKVSADFCIALDGGSIDKIVVKEKGIVQCKLVSRGKAAHGARPWLGENAIERLMADLGRIQTLFSGSAPDHWHRTLNIGTIRAGKALNQVPDYAEAGLDIRYTEGDDPQALITAMRDGIGGAISDIRVEPLFCTEPTPYLELLLKVSPGTRTGSEHGASDARYLSEQGIDGIVWGADGDMSQHSETEHVRINSIAALYDRLSTFLTRIHEIE
jgi:succinyl-diaminopimelate desuccinylase